MITVEQGQTLFDIAIQHCGDATAALKMSLKNQLSLTNDLPAGSTLVPVGVSNAAIVRFFSDNNYIPASAPGEVLIQGAEPTGIGNWIIGSTFKIA